MLLTALAAFAAARLLSVFALPAHAIELSPEDSPTYNAGVRALDDQRWSDAVASFDRVISARDRKADAATYWKAYALNKLGRDALAAGTCAQLRSSYRTSAWNRDCAALGLIASAGRQQSGANPQPWPGDLGDLAALGSFASLGESFANLGDSFALLNPQQGTAPGSDADLKLLALNSLLHREPAQAIPILRGLLSGNQPPAVKSRALFVLAQSNSPEAQSLLHDLVLGRVDPALQGKAIQMFGLSQGKPDLLVEAYRNTSDRAVKRSVISSLFVSGNAGRLVELARAEKDLDLKRSIVSELALMQDRAAGDYMLELLK